MPFDTPFGHELRAEWLRAAIAIPETLKRSREFGFLNWNLEYFPAMPQFSYRARNAQGGLVEGVLDCPDRAVAIRQIELLRYIPVRIEIVGSEPPTAKQANNGAAVAAAPSRGTGVAAAPSLPVDTQKLKIPHG